MRDWNEDLLHFVWQHKLLKPGTYISTSGKEISVLRTGELNCDAGPDFFNAQVKTDGIILAGNIEIHIKTSDWLKHKHQYDKNYDNIILHVVYEHDTSLQQNTDNNVEVLEIKSLLPDSVIEHYSKISNSGQTISCSSQLNAVDDLKFSGWLQRMFVERLESKVKNIEEIFKASGSDYLQTFYTVLLRNFGFKVNALPFELLARQLPVTILLKHADNLPQLEALLMGSAGLLEEQFSDKYILGLQNEFEFLKNKYKIIPLKKELFKFSRLRPANFATLRLAQFAAILYKHPEMFSSPQTYTNYSQISTALHCELSPYWKTHYSPGGAATEKNLQIGEASVSNIITNTFANFFFFYHKKTSLPAFEEIPLQLMEDCEFESNGKTRLYAAKKHFLKTGADSQGLIHLHDHYCIPRKCLSCGIAAAILKPV